MGHVYREKTWTLEYDRKNRKESGQRKTTAELCLKSQQILTDKGICNNFMHTADGKVKWRVMDTDVCFRTLGDNDDEFKT